MKKTLNKIKTTHNAKDTGSYTEKKGSILFRVKSTEVIRSTRMPFVMVSPMTPKQNPCNAVPSQQRVAPITK